MILGELAHLNGHQIPPDDYDDQLIELTFVTCNVHAEQGSKMALHRLRRLRDGALNELLK